MLASDLDNPNFAGARNPDDLLHVEFYWLEPVQQHQSEVQGKEVRGPRQPFVRIMRPGDQTTILEVAVRDDHKARWPQKWLAWQIKNGDAEGSVDLPGWKISDWKTVNADQLQELTYLKFSTVEQLAGASDAQVQRMGIGGLGLREQARLAVKDRNRAEYKAEMEAKDKTIADLAARLDKLEGKQPTLGLPKKG
jgi:hypothetical protein